MRRSFETGASRRETQERAVRRRCADLPPMSLTLRTDSTRLGQELGLHGAATAAHSNT